MRAATAIDTDKETEDWQKMMFSCRQACKVLGIEYNEPEFLNWLVGKSYHTRLWGMVRSKSGNINRK